ncbi:hypothetical protein F7725_018116 [Dissostichus mawsoni]|uniref:Rhomboid-related protein 2 n=1 Tax=Dissostichus mawsoni TaxID=36200 RepID=A0A7J5XS83_DISMA|nr:hypothetical protein F7725_018116 [Dissostichus mawsoni]
MEDNDIEQQEPFPVDRDGRRLRFTEDQPTAKERSDVVRSSSCLSPNGCFQKTPAANTGTSQLLPAPHLHHPHQYCRVFIYYAVWKPQKQWATLDEGIWNSPLTYKPDLRQEAWRFISYMFVHAGVEHIVGNLVMQLLLGIPLELVHKGFEVGMIYMAGVLAGSLASSIFDPLSALVGASGGVYALIGGYFMNAVVNFREMIPLLGIFRILAIVIFVGTDFGFAFYRRFVTHEDGLNVSFVAHFGGIAAGMTIGYVFFSAYNKKLLKDPRFWLCILGYVIFVLFAVLFNIFLTPAP